MSAPAPTTRPARRATASAAPLGDTVGRAVGGRPLPAAPSSRTALVRFLVASLVVALGMSGVGLLTSRRAAETEAVNDARLTRQVIARSLVAPNLEDGVLAGDPGALERLDRAVARVTDSGVLLRVKLWLADGRIVYSDEPRLIGARYPLGEDEQDALVSGAVEAEISDLSRPENRFEKKQGKLLAE